LDQLVFRSRYGYQESSLGIEIPVTLGFAPTQFVSFLAKVDTGAECCIFQREHGDALGIPIENGIPKEFRTVTGTFRTYGHTVTLALRKPTTFRATCSASAAGSTGCE